VVFKKEIVTLNFHIGRYISEALLLKATDQVLSYYQVYLIREIYVNSVESLSEVFRSQIVATTPVILHVVYSGTTQLRRDAQIRAIVLHPKHRILCIVYS
jgi:hypothetical protein